ncbi:MAG: PD40 domain-containing protein [Gemmatimonadaceae bacterium]|nr:PD40 domain-containing protein [Gemmatimonadaceae bacterium]
MPASFTMSSRVRRDRRALSLVVPTLLAALLAFRPVSLAQAQYLTRPERKWETIETAHFRLHYPAEMRVWVRPVAERMESVASSVNALVGNAPTARVTVMVEDPSNVSNGFAVPLLEGPVIFLWPTPPAPSLTFGPHRGWGEILAVHEYGHIAHLTIPTRSGGERWLWRFAPTRLGPVARKSPAWVIEGYATYIEGKLTASGRPNSVGRAAVLREWALEGRLPTYGQLNDAEPYLGGAMRYLVGSAFLEWLVARKGDESLNHLWRRMSARERRSFAEAFRGVYGADPDDLYGAFYTEVMEKALESRRQLQGEGLVQGDLVQKLTWGTGEPALSRDGSRVAVVLRTPNKPSRVVVWSSRDEGLDSNVVRARRRMLARDPQDVAPFDSFPAPKRAQKTLFAVAGRGHDNPRWFADGDRLLVSRDEPLGDGAFRPDLFIWNVRRGGVRRVTHGAGIRSADPAPDGRSAAAVRCSAGVCDLVRVNLANGRITTLVAGSPFVVWHRPRWSPDGTRLAASVQRDGRWWTFVVNAATGSAAPVDPGDGANRYAPSWTKEGKLVVVSERGGVANLELLDPETAVPRPLTRVTGAVAAPDAAPDGSVWFLALHAKGYDVRRLSIAKALGTLEGGVVALEPRLFPAAPPAPTGRGATFAPQQVRGPADYGTGPRHWRILPGGSFGPDGDMASLMIANIDPVGRLSVVAQGGYGQRGAWRGGSIATALRLSPVQLETSGWYTEHAPSEQAAGSFASLNIDSRFTGLGLAARVARDGGAWGFALRAGGSVAQVNGNQLDGAGRVMGFADLRARLTWTFRGLTVSPQVFAQMAQGGTGGDSWTRGYSSGALAIGTSSVGIRAEGSVGTTTTAGPGEFGRAFEQFAVGGSYLPFFDQAFLSQRISVPSVPVGYSSGRKVGIGRLSTRLLGLEPYALWIAAGDKLTRYQRVLGAERSVDVPGIGFARLPGTRLRAGIGYSMDEPYKEKIRPYVSVTYRP